GDAVATTSRKTCTSRHKQAAFAVKKAGAFDGREDREKSTGTRLRLTAAADVYSLPGCLGRPGAVLPLARPLFRRQRERRLPARRGPPRAGRLDTALSA